MRMTNMKCRQVSTLLQNTATHMTKGNWNLATMFQAGMKNPKTVILSTARKVCSRETQRADCLRPQQAA